MSSMEDEVRRINREAIDAAKRGVRMVEEPLKGKGLLLGLVFAVLGYILIYYAKPGWVMTKETIPQLDQVKAVLASLVLGFAVATAYHLMY